MSPKAWSNKVTITSKNIQEIVMDNQKALERMTWKSMDLLEFAESYSNLFKSLGKYTVRLNKVSFGTAVRLCKTQLSPSEIDTLTHKVLATITHIKQRLRDAGSGKFLPPVVVAMEKVWRKHESRPKKVKHVAKGAKEEAKEKKKGEDGIRSVGAKEEKKGEDDIRSVFGLPQKQIEVVSSDQDWLLHLSVGPPIIGTQFDKEC